MSDGKSEEVLGPGQAPMRAEERAAKGGSVGLSALVEAVEGDELLMELAQAAGALEGGERLAAELTSPRRLGAPKSLLARELESKTRGSAYAWQGWEGSRLPAMARLALMRAKRVEKASPGLWRGERESDVWEAMAETARRALSRPDALRARLGPSALDLLERRWERAHPHEVKPLLIALARSGDAASFERLVGMLPAKTAPDPAWGKKELEERRQAAGQSASRRFWSYGVMGAERGELKGFEADLRRAPSEGLGFTEISSPFAAALSRWPDEPERALGLARRGWMTGPADQAWAASALDEGQWGEFERLRSIQWLETGRSSKESAWSHDEEGVALAATLIALRRDDARGLSRVAERFGPVKKALLAPMGKTRFGPWSLAGLAAFLGAGACLEAMAPAIMESKGRAALTRARASEAAMRGPARAWFEWGGGWEDGNEGPRLGGEGESKEDEEGVELSLSVAEAALLSGSASALRAVFGLGRGFERQAGAALERFEAMASAEQRELARELIKAAQERGVDKSEPKAKGGQAPRARPKPKGR